MLINSLQNEINNRKSIVIIDWIGLGGISAIQDNLSVIHDIPANKVNSNGMSQFYLLHILVMSNLLNSTLLVYWDNIPMELAQIDIVLLNLCPHIDVFDLFHSLIRPFA